jgi:integrin beta 3
MPPAGPRPEPPVRAEPATRPRRIEPSETPQFAPVSELPDETRGMRLTALVGLVLVLLVALPAFVLIRDSAKDPLAARLDALTLPAWAAVAHDDQNSGSRWCIQTCRWHERTWRSTKVAKDTDVAYRTALSAAGWTPLTTGCPSAPGTGDYSCWQREQYRLDLWTRDAVCGLNGVVPSPGASLPPSASPSAGSELLPVPGQSPSAPATCNGALVTAKVADRIDPHWQDR